MSAALFILAETEVTLSDMRAALSAHIEELLGLLDFLDGDPDKGVIVDVDFTPSQLPWAQGGLSDRERDAGDEGEQVAER